MAEFIKLEAAEPPVAARDDASELLFVNGPNQALGKHGDAVRSLVGLAFDDGAQQDVQQVTERDLLASEFLGNDREGRRRGLADAEGEMAGCAAHADDQIPA